MFAVRKEDGEVVIVVVLRADGSAISDARCLRS